MPMVREGSGASKRASDTSAERVSTGTAMSGINVTPIPAIVPAQLFCYHLTRAKGYNTEGPRGLSKVTLTW